MYYICNYNYHYIGMNGQEDYNLIDYNHTDIVRATNEDEAIYKLKLEYEEKPFRWLSDIEVQSLDSIAFDVIDVH